MSLVDKSHENRKPAFARAFDGEAAHRQLKVSLLLVTAITIAAFVLGVALPLDAAGRQRHASMGGNSRLVVS